MKVLMAVSRDGYVAKGPGDDMSWTGYEDKAIFRLLTSVGGAPLGVGRVTHDAMPQLKNRTLCPLSRDPLTGTTLERFRVSYPNAWLIGGQTVVAEALRRGLVTQVYLCHSARQLGGGVRADLRILNFGERVADVQFETVRVEVRQ